MSFTVQVKPASNFPIDLYLLMDLSNSMEDDLGNLKGLANNLGKYCGIIVVYCCVVYTYIM